MKRDNIIELVESILQECNIFHAPIPVVEIAEKYGFAVVEKFLKNDESGYMVLYNKGIELQGERLSKIIVINAAENPYRKRFTIAHELGHYFLEYKDKENDLIDDIIVHRDNNYDAINREKEKNADTFAGELLMPTKMLENELAKLMHVDLLFSSIPEFIARQFAVSYSAAKTRYDIFKGKK